MKSSRELRERVLILRVARKMIVAGTDEEFNKAVNEMRALIDLRTVAEQQ
jgi:hypothetical protein